jgi:hypothetical protein
MSDPAVDGESHPKEPTVSASGTGAARASDGGTAISGSVVGSNVNSRFYTLHFLGRAAGWSLPAVVVGLIAVATLFRQPPGRIGQFTPVYVLLGAALLASVLLVILAGEQVARNRTAPYPGRAEGGHGDFFRSGLRLPAALLCLLAAGAGLLWMEYLRNHGEVDLARRHYRIERPTGLGDGEETTLVVDGGTKRDRMRATFSIRDPRPGGGNCGAATTLGVALEGEPTAGANGSLQDGKTAVLRLDGKSEIRVRLTVHTVRRCRVDLGVAKVLLYG